MQNSVRKMVRHGAILTVSAVLALYAPVLIATLADTLPSTWAAVRGNVFTIAAFQAVCAVCLVVGLRALCRSRDDSRLAAIAREAGLAAHRAGKVRGAGGIKAAQAAGREMMVMGCTGQDWFGRPGGELVEALQTCREAKIMLIDPREHGALVRARTMPGPETTACAVRGQVVKSIESIKEAASCKTIGLKLCPDMPLLKMSVLGDFAYVRHYHPRFPVRIMPEFLFTSRGEHEGFYLPLYRYFLSRWLDPDIPEYDFETDELVYRDRLGNEVMREPFPGEIVVNDEAGHGEAVPEPRYVFR